MDFDWFLPTLVQYPAVVCSHIGLGKLAKYVFTAAFADSHNIPAIDRVLRLRITWRRGFVEKTH